MLSLRLTQLTISLIVVAAALLVVFLTRTWFSVVGVAAAISLAVYAGFRTVDKLSSVQSGVIRTVTAKIFPFVRRKVKSYSQSVDPSVGYELEKELCELLDCIGRHCVESWYNHISECQSPVTDARLLINNVTKLLLSRLAGIDRCRFLCKILCLYRQHLNSCSCYEVKHRSVACSAHRGSIYTCRNIAFPDDKQMTNISLSDTVQYLNAVVLMIENKLLDEHSVNCMLGKEILSQIIVKEVILRILDIASEPEWLFSIVADILSDSSIDSSDNLTDVVRITAADTVQVQDRNTSCANEVVDYNIAQATLIDSTDSAVAAENAINTKDASSNDRSRSQDLAGAVRSLCNCEPTQYFNDLDMTEQCAANELSEAKAEDIPAARKITPHASDTDDANRTDSGRLRSNSECCLTCERTKSEISAVENGRGQRVDNGVDISQELSRNSSVMSTDLASFIRKKQASMVSILPSFKTQEDKEKTAGRKSRRSDVCQKRSNGEVLMREDLDAKTGCSAAGSSIFSHKKTKSFSGSESVEHTRPCISHSASVNALAPESGLDTPTGFISQHLSRFVRRFSTGLVRIPLFRSRSSDLLFTEEDCASDVEFAAITDLEASATEASEDFVLDYQPDFLFKNIHISVPERTDSVSKSYTIYVISVRSSFSVTFRTKMLT